MPMPKVMFHPADKVVEVRSGEDLLAAAAKADVHVNASCGGEGTCGKCRVLVSGKRVDSETNGPLSEEEIAKGYVLACKTPVLRDMEVKVPPESELLAKRQTKIKTLTSSLESWNEQLASLECDPPVIKKYFELPEPSLNDSVSDLTRLNRVLKRELGVHDIKVDLRVVKQLPEILRKGGWKVTVTALREEDQYRVTRVEPGKTTHQCYALGVDIGTTTCSAQLIDLDARKILAEVSEINRQTNYGEDVISRMVYAKKGRGLKTLQAKVAQTIDKLVSDLIEKTDVDTKDICVAVMAGNTISISFMSSSSTPTLSTNVVMPA